MGCLNLGRRMEFRIFTKNNYLLDIYNMSNTDNYDFAKSMASQDPSKYTPYVDKQSNLYINEFNSGVYSSGQTLVQFDLSSLYNSSRWVNTDDMFLTIPLTLVSCTSVAGSAPAVVPPTAGWALACLKSGYHNLIHQANLQVDGRTILDTQPFLGTMLNVNFYLKCPKMTLNLQELRSDLAMF